jgi:hypothetical protein
MSFVGALSGEGPLLRETVAWDAASDEDELTIEKLAAGVRTIALGDGWVIHGVVVQTGTRLT